MEQQTGVSLYERDPFRLTGAGEKLFNFIQPMFDGLPRVVQCLGQGVPELVRLGASGIVLRDYLPSILPSVRKRFPDLRLTFSEGFQSQIAVWLKEKRIDLAVSLLHGPPPKGYLSETLLQLPLVLLVPRAARLRSAAELWRQKTIAQTLISAGPEDAITKYFCQGLARHGVHWPIGMVANSMDIVESLVKRRQGIGISIALPGRRLPPGLRTDTAGRFSMRAGGHDLAS